MYHLFEEATTDIDWSEVLVGTNYSEDAMVIIVKDRGSNHRIEIPKNGVDEFMKKCFKARRMILVRSIKNMFKR